jgi:hypothetical protein
MLSSAPQALAVNSAFTRTWRASSGWQIRRPCPPTVLHSSASVVQASLAPLSGTIIAFGASNGFEGIYRFTNGAITEVADNNTPIPGGTGNFTGMVRPLIYGSSVAFRATGSSFQQGIYSTRTGTLERVVDLNTPSPLGGNFAGFGTPAISGINVGIRGGSSGGDGLFLDTGSGLTMIADANTLVPGSSSTFTDFNSPFSLSGSNVAFTAGPPGIYACIGTLVTVANYSTPIPGATGSFTSFYTLTSIDDETIAFVGSGAGGLTGLYIFNDDELTKIIDSTELLDGKLIESMVISQQALSGDNLLFQARFSDGSAGLYVTTVPEPHIASLALLLVMRRRGRNIVFDRC